MDQAEFMNLVWRLDEILMHRDHLKSGLKSVVVSVMVMTVMEMRNCIHSAVRFLSRFSRKKKVFRAIKSLRGQ